MITLERAREQLETLGLAEAAATLDARLEAASKSETPYADFLADLLGGELRVRRERYLLTRTKLARLPFKKTLEQFDFDAQPSIDRKQVNELASLSFVAHADNLILLGPPGVGKTHLSVAIGIQAIEHGYGVYFTSMHRVLEDLRVAHEERRLERRLRVYLAPKLLIIDEFGYLPLDKLGATLLFQLVAARYERGSILLTSNQSFGEWGDVLGDPVIATAILDRLLHHSHVINIRDGMRRPPSLRRSHPCGAALPWVTGRWPEKWRTAVNQHSAGRRIAGVDLGDGDSFVCVIDDVSGEVVERATIPTSSEAFERYFARHAPMLVALETGTHSPWASRAVAGAGHEVIVANARQLPLIYGVKHKSDVRDGEKLARVARMDARLLAPVQHRPREQQRDLSVVRSRHALVRSRTLLINAARGMVKAFGCRLPKCAADAFHKVAWPYVPSELGLSLQPVFESIGTLTRQIRALEDEIDRLASETYPQAQLLTQVPGVGNLTALAYLLTLGDPKRFSSSRMVGPYLGLAPGRRQSGGREQPTRITKAGDQHLRWLLVQSANHILRRDSPDTDLKRHGRKLAKSGSKISKRIAKVAVARKLAVVLHALLVTGEVYEPLRNTQARRRRQPLISA